MAKSAAALLTVYGAGALQGFAFVLIPALGDRLKSGTYSLSVGAYGALFLPEIVGAIVAALLAGVLQRRLGPHGLFRLGLACNAVAAALLASSAAFAGGGVAYGLLLVETALLGLGFGFIQAVINGFAVDLFPATATAAVTVLNALIGGATAVSPLVLAGYGLLGAWWGWPATLAACFLLVLGGAFRVRLPRRRHHAAAAIGSWRPLLWFAAAVLVYAIIEGSFSSWAVVYVGSTRHAAAYGAACLTAFWASMTLMRLGLSFVPARRVSPRLFYFLSPPAMAAAFVAVALSTAPLALLPAYLAAGAACGIFYPFSMAFALARYRQAGTRVAGILVAALMVGEGIGSFLPGGLQHAFSLTAILGFSALWGLPLVAFAIAAARRDGSSQ